MYSRSSTEMKFQPISPEMIDEAVQQALRHEKDSAPSDREYAEELVDEIKHREALERTLADLVEQNRREREQQCKK